MFCLSEVGYEKRLFNYTRNKKVERELIEDFKILKGYENNDQEVFLICYVTVQPSWSFIKVK